MEVLVHREGHHDHRERHERERDEVHEVHARVVVDEQGGPKSYSKKPNGWTATRPRHTTTESALPLCSGNSRLARQPWATPSLQP